jgi:hypothetical protein
MAPLSEKLCGPDQLFGTMSFFFSRGDTGRARGKLRRIQRNACSCLAARFTLTIKCTEQGKMRRKVNTTEDPPPRPASKHNCSSGLSTIRRRRAAPILCPVLAASSSGSCTPRKPPTTNLYTMEWDSLPLLSSQRITIIPNIEPLQLGGEKGSRVCDFGEVGRDLGMSEEEEEAAWNSLGRRTATDSGCCGACSGILGMIS